MLWDSSGIHVTNRFLSAAFGSQCDVFCGRSLFGRKPPLAEMPSKEAQAKAHVSARGLKRAREAAEPQGPVHAEDVERLVLEGKRSWLYNHFHL